MAKKTSTQTNGEAKPKKPRGERKTFAASMREKTEKRLAALLKTQAKQRSVTTEIAECERILSTLGNQTATQPDFEPNVVGTVRPPITGRALVNQPYATEEDEEIA